MKFKFGNFKDITEHGRFETSMLEQFINTDSLSKDMTLQQVADKIKEFLELEHGDIELIVAFRYHKRVGDA